MRTGSSVRGVIHYQTCFAQGGNDVLSQPLLVFDQKHAHDKTT
jgi:hypothetical protein